jgi:SAM-dependent methyltransferase
MTLMAGLSCPLCDHDSWKKLKSFEDGVVVGRCLHCGLLYTPRCHPSPESLFENVRPDVLRLLYSGIASGKVDHFRTRSFEEYLAILRRHGGAGRLLDIGCAHGFFLVAARRAGFEVSGVEPNPGMAGYAREILGLDVLEGTLQAVDLGGRTWDVVTFTDSLEYLPEPVAALRRVVAHLSPGGLLFAKVPNGDYFLLMSMLEALGLRHGGDGAFTPSRRVVHYTGATLRRLGTAVGLRITVIGNCRPITRPSWERLTGLALEVAPPWWLWPGGRLLRRALHILGRLEGLGTPGRRNHLAQSVYLLARKEDGMTQTANGCDVR